MGTGGKRAGAGRPRKDAGEKRSRSLSIAWTEAEYEHGTTRAKAAQVSLAEYVRRLALSHEPMRG